MSQGADISLFSNYPCSATDKVFINVNKQDLKSLLLHSNSDSAHLSVFYNQVTESFDGQRAIVTYGDALFAIQTLIETTDSLF
jgi:hypothetical protein